MAYNNLYIVDNSTEQQSVKEYLTDWCKVSKQMDIATGYLEIGGLLALDTHWQKLDKIRPMSLGQAGRISGVSPADIGVLLIYLEQKKDCRTER